MFSRLLSSIKESINRSGNGQNKQRDNTSEYINESQRLSVSEKSNFDNSSILSKFSTTQSISILPTKSTTEPIPIVGSVTSTATGMSVNERRGSLFGISNVAYDDYVQKDLISTSWS